MATKWGCLGAGKIANDFFTAIKDNLPAQDHEVHVIILYCAVFFSKLLTLYCTEHSPSYEPFIDSQNAHAQIVLRICVVWL